MRKRQGKDKKYWDDLFELRYGKGAHVDQVDKMQEEEEVDVEEAKKEGIWPLLPKWTVDGTPENKQIARDVMIPYAVDEGECPFSRIILSLAAQHLPLLNRIAHFILTSFAPCLLTTFPSHRR